MKRRFALLFLTVISIIFINISAMASMNFDLSNMSYDELVELRHEVDFAIWASEEWQEVVVPIGIYKVGDDIPEGYWDISAYDGKQTLVTWGTSLDDNGTSVQGIIDYGFVVSPTSRNYNEASSRCNFYFQVQNGQYIEIVGASAVFKTYSGKNLGFK